MIFQKNKDNPAAYQRFAEEVHEITFAGKTAYKFTMVAEGMGTDWGGSWGDIGTISMIVCENNDKLYIIGYYEESPFQTMIETFLFE